MFSCGVTGDSLKLEDYGQMSTESPMRIDFDH